MATNQTNRGAHPAELLAGLLDQGYTEATAHVIRAITRDADQGLLATRLQQFEDHAAALAADGKTLAADDPVLRALLADFGEALQRQAVLIDTAAPELQEISINAAGEFVSRTAIGPPGIVSQMFRPDPDAVASVVQYTGSEAWRDELAAYGDGADKIRQIAIRGMVSGRGPVAIARDMRAAIDGVTRAQAEGLMRSLQLTAFRDAQVAVQTANADLITRVIRIAALDGRTCFACWALHGSELAVGERVDDHRRGRCTSVVEVGGVQRNITPGPDVLAQMLATEQAGALSQRQEFTLSEMRRLHGASMRALEAGAVQLRDFVQHKTDPVFGEVVTEASLKGILGSGAREYYLNTPGA